MRVKRKQKNHKAQSQTVIVPAFIIGIVIAFILLYFALKKFGFI
jgi:ABC-type multidrug transport system permease subunit